jgi:hypothetical protein
MKTTIYDLDLHDDMDVGLFSVFRVAGGWIYYDKNVEISTFVPYNEEFKERTQRKCKCVLVTLDDIPQPCKEDDCIYKP